MDIGRIAVRALVAYVYLLFNTRASGKRVIAQATPFDFVVSLIGSEGSERDRSVRGLA